jgi:hypothetical protein
MVADRIGLQKMLVSGIGLWQCLLRMGLNHNIYIFIGVFMPQRPQVSTWISNMEKETSLRPLAPHLCFSKCLHHMLASSLARLIWYQFRPNATFMWLGSKCLILFYFVISTSKKKQVVFTLKTMFA